MAGGLLLLVDVPASVSSLAARRIGAHRVVGVESSTLFADEALRLGAAAA